MIIDGDDESKHSFVKKLSNLKHHFTDTYQNRIISSVSNKTSSITKYTRYVVACYFVVHSHSKGGLPDWKCLKVSKFFIFLPRSVVPFFLSTYCGETNVFRASMVSFSILLIKLVSQVLRNCFKKIIFAPQSFISAHRLVNIINNMSKYFFHFMLRTKTFCYVVITVAD